MVYRVYNFNPGPATLPLPVLEQAQKEIFNYKDTGMSVMEISHRSPVFEELITSAESLLLELLGLPENYQVLFLQGGASLQFTMVPFNLLPAGRTADYIITGSFAKKAAEEASRLGNIHVAADTKGNSFRNIPRPEEIQYSENPAYVHITTNNTIYGTQWKHIPDTGQVPLIADMSSDILSRKIDISKFSLVYAGAQKNLGPSGVTAVIINKDIVDRSAEDLPSMLSYKVLAESRSLFNTPPTYSIYILGLVLEWVKNNGGLETIQKRNEQKAALIYEAIDDSGGFYRGHADKEDRSTMNVTFRLSSEELEKTFLEKAAEKKLMGLKGHRSVGGIRASIYNAFPLEGCEILAQFMKEFSKQNG